MIVNNLDLLIPNRIAAPPQFQLNMASAKSSSPLALPYNPSSISFLDLPAETRVQIYCLLFRRDATIWLTGHRGHSNVHERIDTGLLRSCRKIYAEAHPFLYDANTFAVNGLSSPNEMCGKLGTPACAFIKRLKIWSYPFHFPRLLEDSQMTSSNVPCRAGNRDRTAKATTASANRPRPLPSLGYDRSVWYLISHHLAGLEHIELGLFEAHDFHDMVTRYTSSTVADDQPAPIIELHVIVYTQPRSGIFTSTILGTLDKYTRYLSLSSVKSIRLSTCLPEERYEAFKQRYFRNYTISEVQELDEPERLRATCGNAAYLLTLERRPKRPLWPVEKSGS